jgi:3-hydroxybutyryl-CoA dehydrogenase
MAKIDIQSCAVVGGGFMGSGIAESVARAGFRITVVDVDEAALERCRTRVERSMARAIEGGKLDAAGRDAAWERISMTNALEDLNGADLVIEAVPEDVAIKDQVMRALDRIVPDTTIVASNTSSIPIAELASNISRPQRVLGLHFFSPVPVMRLVEVVVALDTSPETVEAAEGFAQSLGKHPIRTNDRSGFVVNMLLVPYLMAAVRMYEEGFASREDIDTGMKLGCGRPMGPLTLSDFIGLDVLYAVCNSIYEEFKRPEYAPPPLMKRMIASGRLGRKTGRGFYEYDENGEQRKPPVTGGDAG